MPRMRRIVLPEYPHHIVQRGHDRNVVFAIFPMKENVVCPLLFLGEQWRIRLGLRTIPEGDLSHGWAAHVLRQSGAPCQVDWRGRIAAP